MNLPKMIKGVMVLLVIGCVMVGVPTAVNAHDSVTAPNTTLTPPPMPELPSPTEGQTVFYIDPTQSQAQYAVQEQFVGMDSGLVVGATNHIEGSVLIDWNNPQQSQVGAFVVNVEQLTSDSNLRDERIRKDYLESSLYPEAVFIPEVEQDFPATVVQGEPISLVLHGYLTVHDVTILTDWQMTLTVEADHIVGQAETKINMSDVGVGPISIIGLLSTEDEMTLTFDFIATTDTNGQPLPIETIELPQTAEDFDFANAVQPILETKCVGCHVQGEIGHTIFPMDTVEDVVLFADDLPLVLQTGYMPPWLPSHQAPAFKGDRSLSATEMAMLLAWIDADAPVNVPLETPLTDTAPTGAVVREDIKLSMPAPYEPTGEHLDDYRCFLLDPQLPNGGYVTASQAIPGDRRVVHHVVIFQAEAESRAEAEELAAVDDRMGWECFGGPGLSTAAGSALGNNLGVWVPGSQPWFAEEGVGIAVPPNGLIVLQVHYNYEAGFYPDETGFVLQVEPADADIIPLHGVPLIAPVEIPCPTGLHNANCDRDTSLAQMDERDQQRAEQFLRMCNKELNDYEGQAADNATSFCDWRVPIDGEIMEINGHMHTYGKSTQVVLNPDTPNAMILQDLPIWDFNWQGSYTLQNPVSVKQGDVLRITCTWDNTNVEPTEDKRYITWGEGTRDEMCVNILRIKPTPDFEDVSSRYLIVNSLMTMPNWMPNWARTVWLMVQQTVSVNTFILLVGVMACGAVVLGYRKKQRPFTP